MRTQQAEDSKFVVDRQKEDILKERELFETRAMAQRIGKLVVKPRVEADTIFHLVDGYA